MRYGGRRLSKARREALNRPFTSTTGPQPPAEPAPRRRGTVDAIDQAGIEAGTDLLRLFDQRMAIARRAMRRG